MLDSPLTGLGDGTKGARARLSSRFSGKQSSGATQSSRGTCGGARCLASLEDERDGGGRRWFMSSRERMLEENQRKGEKGREETATCWLRSARTRRKQGLGRRAVRTVGEEQGHARSCCWSWSAAQNQGGGRRRERIWIGCALVGLMLKTREGERGWLVGDGSRGEFGGVAAEGLSRYI